VRGWVQRTSRRGQLDGHAPLGAYSIQVVEQGLVVVTLVCQVQVKDPSILQLPARQRTFCIWLEVVMHLGPDSPCGWQADETSWRVAGLAPLVIR